MRKTILWTLAILLAAASAPAEQPVDVTRAVSPDATISIDNLAGSLTIIGVDGGELRITGTMGDDVEELEIRGDGDEIDIEVAIPDDDDWKGRRKVAANLEVRVPSGASLDIETVSASIDIRGVRGEIEAGSVSGAVVVAGGPGDIEAESVSGAVTVSGPARSIIAESVSGKVTAEGVSGDLEATTVSGKIHVTAVEVSDAEIESVAGSIFFEGRVGRSLEVESHSGTVEVLVPADQSANFELETFSGRIANGLGPAARRTERYEPGLSAEFQTGSGGAEISLETFSGNIILDSF